jgi:hypothetical protein
MLRELFRITHAWLLYVLVIVLAANLPHRAAPWLSWLNSSLYFLLFLLALHIWRTDKYNRDIFGLFTLSYLALASSFVLIFIGKGALFGSQRLALIAYVEGVLVMEFLLTSTLVLIALKYAFPEAKPAYLLIGTLVFVAATFVVLFGRHLLPAGIYYANLPIFYRHLFELNLVTLAAVLFYLVTLVRHDRIIGEYVTSVVIVYLFRSILNGVSLAGAVFGFRLFEVDQYFLTLTLVMLAVVLFRKLCYALSPFGQYYEDLLHGHGGLQNIKVTRRNDVFSFSLLEYMRVYLSRRPHLVGALTVVLVGALQSLPLNLFVRLNLIAMLFLIISVYTFFYIVYRRRSKSGFLLPETRRMHEHS